MYSLASFSINKDCIFLLSTYLFTKELAGLLVAITSAPTVMYLDLILKSKMPAVFHDWGLISN